jgi:hypothetical protein
LPGIGVRSISFTDVGSGIGGFLQKSVCRYLSRGLAGVVPP